MELKFRTTSCSCLNACLREVQNGEETLEIRLPDGLPDIGKVLLGWGQPIVRSKEWRSQQIIVACGLMIWVLYAPEDGSSPRCLEGWIPYQMRWDIPESKRDGIIRLQLLPRFVDARTTGPRKLMVRSGLAFLAEAFVQSKEEFSIPEDMPEQIQLQSQRYPVRVMKEAGERSFHLDEELNFPPSAPQPERLLYYTLRPEITDQKVIANKVVFRGTAHLHLLYEAEGGQFQTWDFPLGFSQYAELEETRGPEAQADVALCVTGLELDLDDEGHLRLKAGLAAQYLVDELQMQEVVTDAYCPGRQLQLQTGRFQLPVTFDSRRETLSGDQTLKVSSNAVVDILHLADFPVAQKRGEETRFTMQNTLQLLSYGGSGALEASTCRWESEFTRSGNDSCTLLAQPGIPQEPQILFGSDTVDLHWEVPVRIDAFGTSDIPYVSDLELGEAIPASQDGPNLLLKRAGEGGLWQLAKQSGSTVEAILRANRLQQEPAPGQMLLIPICSGNL